MERTYVYAVRDYARDGLGMSHKAAGFLALRKVREREHDVDILQVAILYHINEYRLRTFDNFRVDVGVKASKHGEPFAVKWHGFIICPVGVDWYKFTLPDGREKRMLVRTVKDNILVAYGGRWQSIEAYLAALQADPVHRAAVRSESLCMSQWKFRDWWSSNGKSFRLLDLPAEVRENIYKFALVNPALPYPSAKARKLAYGSRIRLRESNPTVSLMRVNRQVYTEARHIFYRDAPFILTHKPVLCRVLNRTELSSNIRRLHLALSHAEYIKLFGFQFNEIQGYAPHNNGVVGILRDMRFDKLELYISPPAMVGEEMWLDGACQRTIVNWIFEAAWPWIRGHPVKFTGYVKNSQKKLFDGYAQREMMKVEKWQSLRAEWGVGLGTLSEYDEFLEDDTDDEDGGVRLDGAEAKEVEGVDQWPADRVEVEFNADDGRERVPQAPICMCRTECSAERWTARD